MTKTTLKAAKIVCLDDEDTILESGYIGIENGRICSLSQQPPQQGEIIDLGQQLLMPGLINAHTHSPMVLFRGLAEGHSLFHFEGWYNTIRVVEEVMTPDLLPAAVQVSCAEMIRTGTTCFADQYFWMDHIVPAVRQSGMRAALAYGIVELGEEDARQRELAAAAEFLDSLKKDKLITGWVGPHAFFVDNSEESMQDELALAAQYQTGFHIHLSTSGEEDRYCQEAYGQTAVAQMAAMGILDHPIVAAHCLTVPHDDFGMLVNGSFTAVAAISSCMRNAAGVAPILEMQQAGINIGLGTDNVTNNNSYDMFKEMQLLGKLMSLQHRIPNALSARDILHMATRNGAKALGLAEEIGSLEVGKRADLISLDLSEIGWSPMAGQDVYTALVYSVSGMHVQNVMVEGSWLYRNGRYQTLDYAQATKELNQNFLALQDLMR